MLGTVCLCACKGNDKFLLQGQLSDCPYDEIWVVYDDPISKLDTIFPKEGKFKYELTPDTTTLFRLVVPGLKSIPMVAEKGDKVDMEGSLAEPVIVTKGANKVYADFLASLKGVKPTDEAAKAEEVIRQNPQSFISAYLVDRYFVQQEKPDVKKIRELMAPLDGKVKDSRVLTTLYKVLQDEKDKPRGVETLGYFSYKDRNKKYISWSLPDGGYALINVWASWDTASRQLADSLKTVADKLPEGKFRVINVSIDNDSKTWLSACKDDSKKWVEVCDFKGWNTSVVQQSKIRAIPANFLIDKNRKIIKKDMFDHQELYKEVKRLLDKKP